MTNNLIRIEVGQGEVGEILKELTEAQEKIYECYCKLQDLGVVTFSKADAPALEKFVPEDSNGKCVKTPGMKNLDFN